MGIAQFVVVVVASIIVGLVVGMLGAFITRFSEHVHGKYTSVPDALSHDVCMVLPQMYTWTLVIFV